MTSAGPDLARLQKVLDQFEITIAEANDLVVLMDYNIMIIADDSGSMTLSAEPAEERQLGKPSLTRWAELQNTLSAVIDVAACFDPQGVDVHFLNRTPVRGVQNQSDTRLKQAFQTPPAGATPLTQMLQRVAKESKLEKGMLLLVFTDGEPSGGREDFRNALKQLVKQHNVRVQIMACTADENVVAWLSEVDEEFAEVDVTDDYYSERKEVLRAGLAPRFTRGDWCMKAMLGPVSRKYDLWDERLAKPNQTECGECCVM
mmetsp:Transcript_77029/g.160289  ORF Transcript_77029/g.160289 Transcript_77029/m.160289 type:complete len:259 (+) Transcript_77029:128-904(+)